MNAPIIAFEDNDLFAQLERLHWQDKLFVTPTDTVYGLSCRPESSCARDRLVALKGNRHYIVIAHSTAHLDKLVRLTRRDLLEKYWPGAITFVLPTLEPNQTLAVRIPSDERLRAFLRQTGPLLSTSCNLPGKPTAQSVGEALSVFGDQVDFYLDGGQCENTQPSTLVDLTQAPPKVLRQGKVKFEQG